MKWALVDVSWLAYRAKHAMGGLAHEGTATGVLYGFFEQLRTVCAHPRVATSRAALFFDSHKSYRRLAYPAYKGGARSQRTPEEWATHFIMQEQLKRLRQEILPSIGFPVYKQAGLESDDLIAQAAEQLHAATIITADGDLYQCCTDKVVWFDPQRNLYVDHLQFYALKGCDVQQWAEVKAIAGCDTDNVKGVPGVGEKTAVDYVMGVLPAHHARYKAITSPAGRAVVRRNLPLVKLPHPRTQPLVIEEPKYDAAKFFKWAERLGFKSYLGGGRQNQWEAFFAGEPMANRQLARPRARSAGAEPAGGL